MFGRPEKRKFGQAMPPAVFPSVFGLIGLGLAWRRAEEVFNVPFAIADIFLGAVTLLFVFCAFVYGVKFLRRPAVLLEDLKILPGRAGISALSLSVLLMAVVFLRFSTDVARGVFFAGLIGHMVLAALMIYTLVRSPAEQRRVTPIWHLSFVGFILAPLSGIPLEYQDYCAAIFIFTVGVAVGIWCVSALQLFRETPPPPLRPLLAIHLAPASLFGTVAAMMGWPQIALGFGVIALGILAALVVFARFLTVAGFSPLWGAFTFPLAAFSTMCMTLFAAGQAQVFYIAGGLSLVAATLIVPPIAFKVVQAWAKGTLAVKTNAAVA